MADCAYVHTDDELEQSGDEDSDVEATEQDQEGGWFSSASDWLTRTKETIVAKSRAAAFQGMQGLLDSYSNSALWHNEAGAYAVERVAGGPRGKEEVVVVGGGPGGVLMAMKLKKLGHPVIILEKSDHIGGKALSVDYRKVTHELGACYLSPEYKEVTDLLAEYGLDEQYEVVGHTVWQEESPTTGLSLRNWMYRSCKIANLEPDVSDAHIALEIFAHTFKYVGHHRRLLKNYSNTGFLPPRPAEAEMAELGMTIEEFLDHHNLRSLKPIFQLAYTLQGYGYIAEESILYGFLWVTPTLLISLLERLKVRKVLRKKRLRQKPLLHGSQKQITTLKNGFQTLFKAIVERDSIPVIFNANITAIKRDDKGVTIDYYREFKDASGQVVREEPVTKRSDFLVMAAPPPQAFHLMDLRDDERQLFADVHESTFVTTLVDYEPGKPLGDSASDSYLDNLVPQKPMSVWLTRDTHQVARTNGIYPELEHEHIGTFVAYQFTSQSVNDTKGATETEVSAKVQEETESALEELKRHLNHFGKKVVRTEQFRHRYFPRHSPEQMHKGVLWDILEMQGKYRTWYTGSAVCFEAINAILGYNDELIQVWQRQEEIEVIDGLAKGQS